MIYLITYELNNKGRDYTGLYDSIKSFGTWWHYIDSTWLIDTDSSVQQVNDKIHPHIDEALDNLLVVEISKDAARQGWLPKKAWEWIRNR